jgi:hypothetical protein
MAQITIPNNNVVTSKAETPEAPVVVNQQSLLSALSYLRTELDKLKKENKELSTERTTLFEQLEKEKNKNNNNIIDNNNKILEDSNNINNKDNDEGSTLSENDDDHKEKKLIEELKEKIEQIEKEKKEEITNIELQLEQSREEKKQLEVQHQSLIAKLANFKTYIADKLKADNVLILFYNNNLFYFIFIFFY